MYCTTLVWISGTSVAYICLIFWHRDKFCSDCNFVKQVKKKYQIILCSPVYCLTCFKNYLVFEVKLKSEKSRNKSKSWKERALSGRCRNQKSISVLIFVLIRHSWDAIVYDLKVWNSNVVLNWSTSCELIKQSQQSYFTFYTLILGNFHLQLIKIHFVGCKRGVLCMTVFKNFLESFSFIVSINDAHFCTLFNKQ